MDLMNVPAKFEALPVPEIIASTVLKKLCAVPVYAVQGHPRSLISVPIESAHMTSY